MTIREVATTGSTNADLLALARDGAVEGSWLRADAQTGGRGRHGRPWVSPPGNLYASTLVRHGAGDPPPATLALVAAIALHDTVAAYVDRARLMLKWPNDLLLDGAKVSGILLEAAGDAVVIGIGVNLAHHPRDLDRPTASLGADAPPARAFLSRLAPGFADWLREWREGGLDPIREAWLARAHPLGTRLAADSGAGRIDGRFDGLDPDGALRLATADGVVVIHAADLFLV